MKVFFLEARVPLTKRFTATHKEPYPNAYEFKSHEEVVKSIDHFADLIRKHAALGHCLLKGELTKPLHFESRAGSTNPNYLTNFVCFDLDGITSVATADEFMNKIGLGHVSYVLQYSASYNMYGDTSLRAHVFILLTGGSPPPGLKMWLKQLNFDHFTSDLSLTKTNVALRWPVDITTCQNDKLLFITAPQVDPPQLTSQICSFTGQRITCVKKATDFFDFSKIQLQSAEHIKATEEAEINRLRKAINLPERKASGFKMKDFKGEAYLPNPDQATVTGVKEERGFVYLNLNGGDSWGYFHPIDNPTFISNFKGEPTYKTAELVPDYWNSLQQAKRQAAKVANQGKLFLAFRDFRTAEYYNGWYDENTEELLLHTARSEKQLQDFLANYGQPVPEAIPIWSIKFDPHSPPLDLISRTVNVFCPSFYMRHARAKANLTKPKATPMINKIIEHVFGASQRAHFINWLAYAFQYCAAPTTAWIAHGTQGTGKGVLINHVIVPIFGPSNVAQKRMEELEDKFNDYLENSLICAVDEAQISDSGRSKMIMANLKNQITEPTITIRRMRQSAYEVTNRVGFIFNSNKPDPVVVEAGDRRFNVGEYQPNKLNITTSEIKQIENELLDFACMLQAYAVDFDKVRTPLLTESKKQMILVSRSSADAVADALQAGDLSVLWDALPSSSDDSLLDIATAMKLQPYRQLVYELVQTKRDRLTREELYVIFNYNVGNISNSPWKFTIFLNHHNIKLKTIRFGPRTNKGIVVDWTNSDEWFEERRAEIAAEKGPKLKVVSSTPKSDAA